MYREVSGLLITTLWLYTIVAGFFVLYAPLLPLLLIDHVLYRLLVDHIFALWQLYPVALFQWILKCRLHHYGDFVSAEETSIILVNHRTRVDWNYVWLALYHATGTVATDADSPASTLSCNTKNSIEPDLRPPDDLNSKAENIKADIETELKFKTEEEQPETREISEHFNLVNITSKGDNNLNQNETSLYRRLISRLTKSAKLKYVLKDEIKFIPAIGWIMQLNYFLFLKRSWSEDQCGVSHFLEYYRGLYRTHCYNYQLLLFPEGTDLSAENRRRSDAFAAANNLQPYDFVLHPRTTGFAVLCSRMRDAGLAAIYDATIAYDAPPDTELAILRGRCPADVYVHFKRYEVSELPRGEEPLRRWLIERWRNKEDILRHFHNHGSFDGAEPHAPRSLSCARYAFLLWSVVDVAFFIGVLFSDAVCFWMTYNALLLVAVTWRFGGFHRVQHFAANYIGL